MFYGATEWTGCPRRALGPREAAWVRTWDRCEGRLSASEMLTMPMLLVDAFDVLDEWRVERQQYEAERRKG